MRNRRLVCRHIAQAALAAAALIATEQVSEVLRKVVETARRATSAVPGEGRLFGVLHLAGGPDGGFSDEEEELVVALAALAGAAIRNAQLSTAGRRRDECSATSLNVVSAALDRPPQALTLVARGARRYTDAAIAAVEVRSGKTP
jgi:hypothetical protein